MNGVQFFVFIVTIIINGSVFLHALYEQKTIMNTIEQCTPFLLLLFFCFLYCTIQNGCDEGFIKKNEIGILNSSHYVFLYLLVFIGAYTIKITILAIFSKLSDFFRKIKLNYSKVSKESQ